MNSLGGRIPQLYGLRGISILAVLITHLWTYPTGYTVLNRLAAAGWLGVQLSFVLSGFLITKILHDSRNAPNYYLNFYARRSLRIMPLFFAVLLTVFLVLPLLITLPEQLLRTSWMYWVFLSNFAIAAGGWQLFLTDITWSLAVEEQFYLVWPAIVRWATRSRLLKLCVAILIAAPLARLAVWSPENWRWVHMMMPLRADAFAMGALMYLIPLSRMRPWAAPVFLLGAATLLALILTGNFGRTSLLAGTIGYTLVAGVAASGLIVALDSKVLASKALIHVGTVSFGIYLLHPMCLMVSSSLQGMLGVERSGLTGSILQLTLTAALAIAVATVSFRYFETPILKLRKYFPTERSTTATQAA